jgi:hypothetical protein
MGSRQSVPVPNSRGLGRPSQPTPRAQHGPSSHRLPETIDLTVDDIEHVQHVRLATSSYSAPQPAAPSRKRPGSPTKPSPSDIMHDRRRAELDSRPLKKSHNFSESPLLLHSGLPRRPDQFSFTSTSAKRTDCRSDAYPDSRHGTGFISRKKRRLSAPVGSLPSGSRSSFTASTGTLGISSTTHTTPGAAHVKVKRIADDVITIDDSDDELAARPAPCPMLAPDFDSDEEHSQWADSWFVNPPAASMVSYRAGTVLRCSDNPVDS